MKNEEKIRIRKEILNIRNKMDSEEAQVLGKEIISNLIKMPLFKNSKNIMVYLSFKNEVNTYGLISHCYEQDKKVIVPYTVKDKRQLVPTIVKDMDKELMKSSFGYMEPKPEYLRPVQLDDIDLIIMPGVAFDKMGYRIGFGGGYYDRFLAKFKSKVPTIAIAYDFQVVDRVPTEEFDIPIDYIITEKRIIVR